MKLDAKQFKRFKALSALVKAGKASEAELKEFEELKNIKLRVDSKDGIGNPVELWNKYPTLFRDATNIPFNYRKGTYFGLDPMTASTSQPDGNEMPYMTYGTRVEYLRTPGKSTNANDGINYQARKLWTTLHRIYRGIGTYEYADLGIAEWCIMNAFADLARAERIYGIFNEFQILNRTVPDKLFGALGVENVPVTGAELADFRYNINRIVAKAKTLCLPRGISLLESFLLLDSNIFKDSDSYRATWIVYDTPFRVQYDATASTGGRGIYVSRTKTGTNGLQTLSDIIDDLNTDFDILLTDTDIARICSDMLAAIAGKDLSNADGLVILKTMPEEYRISPVKDESRLLQLHNTTLVGSVASEAVPTAISRVTSGSTSNVPADTLQVYQDGGVIYCDLAAVTGSTFKTRTLAGKIYFESANGSEVFLRHSAVLDIWKDDVSPEDIMEMTRQTVTLGYETFTESGSGSIYKRAPLESFGNIVCLNMSVYYETGSNGSITDNHVLFDTYTFSQYNTSQVEKVMIAACVLSQIDWHPVLVVRTPTTGVARVKMIFGDIDNVVSISAKNLARLHDCAMISGWVVPIAEQLQGDK